MTLDYLDFEFSEDAQGHGTFDAMASVAPAQLAALQGEVVAVLAWAHAEFPNRAPLEEGGEWDCELQGTREVVTGLHVHYDPKARSLQWQPGDAAPPRTTLSVTVSGTPGFCAAFRAEFAID